MSHSPPRSATPRSATPRSAIQRTAGAARPADPAPSPPPDRLAELDRILARDPAATDALRARAALHREQDAFASAKRDYLELIRREPTDFAALNDFGTLVLKAGYREAARSLFTAAVRHHPDNANGRVNLGNLLLLLGELDDARAHFEAALTLDPGHVHAHRGLGNLLAERGDEAGARRHRDLGFKGRAVTVLPYRGAAPPIALLLLVAAAGGNIPTEALIDDRRFAVTVLVADYADANAPLPPHDVVFNAIGDADLCGEALAAACALVARSPRPVVNHPARVAATGRLANAERLRGLPGVVVPRLVMVPRKAFAAPALAAAAVAASGLEFPLLVRAPGFHTGRHFLRAETAAELAAAAAQIPADAVWLIAPLEARDALGNFRKYRAMFVGGALYPLHLALSRHWKVHYFTADMAESAAHRAQDAAFLADLSSIGGKAVAALHRIRDALGLDYGGVDFAVDAGGDVLFFEANATMAVYPPLTDPKWDYRRGAVEAVIAAVQTMLVERAQQGPSAAGREAANAASG